MKWREARDKDWVVRRQLVAFSSMGEFVAEADSVLELEARVQALQADEENDLAGVPTEPEIVCWRNYRHPAAMVDSFINARDISEHLDSLEVLHDFDSICLPESMLDAVRDAFDLPGVEIPYWEDEPTVLWENRAELE